MVLDLGLDLGVVYDVDVGTMASANASAN